MHTLVILQTPDKHAARTAADVALSYIAMGMETRVVIRSGVIAAIQQLATESDRDILQSFSDFDLKHVYVLPDSIDSFTASANALPVVSPQTVSDMHCQADVIYGF